MALEEEEDQLESDDAPGQNHGVVAFSEDEEEGRAEGKPAKLSGRRARREKELKKKMRTGTFESLGLSNPVLRAIKRQGYRLPTPIQRRTLPLILQGSDIIGMARTGSGKTAAFVIPMVEKLQSHSPKAGARAVLLSPTRELALQTHKAVRDLARYTDLRTAVLVGGDALEAQFAELANNPDVLVATPGRLLHHLAEVEGLGLRSVEYCVVDEADRMFEMGFAEQVREILGKMTDRRQTLLFSATLPSSLAEFASAGLTAPQLVRLDSERRISPNLQLAFFTVRQEDKVATLLYLVKEALAASQQTLIFAATRHHVEYLANLMARDGIPAACVYGSMDQTARKIHVAKFRVKKVSLLITTDVAARGIDIPLIDNVINLDFPPKPELFVHRVGRAARMGRCGTAYSLLTRDELPYLLDLHLYLGRPVRPAPLVPDAAQVAAASQPQDNEGASLFGSVPDELLSPQIEHLRELHACSTDLSSVERTLSNAFALYLRTRPPASAESVKRCKQLGKEGAHPSLLAALPQTRFMDHENEAALAQFTAALRGFRPTATVLEAEIASVKSSFTSVPLLQSNHFKSRSHDVMQRKRLEHASGETDILEEGAAAKAGHMPSATKEAARKAAEFGDGVLSEGKYRDSNLFISYTRDPNRGLDDSFLQDKAAAELQAAVMDMTAEDQEGMAAQQRRWHWDKRKKKYVRVAGSEATAGQAARRVKNESGKTAVKGVDGRNKGIYQKWVKSQHRRVAASGSLEAEGSGVRAQQLATRFDRSQRHTSWKGPKLGGAARGPVELKSKEQVRTGVVAACLCHLLLAWLVGDSQLHHRVRDIWTQALPVVK
ncbi:DEAD-domain-containing protein [Haematococcus lacustris]